MDLDLASGQAHRPASRYEPVGLRVSCWPALHGRALAGCWRGASWAAGMGAAVAWATGLSRGFVLVWGWHGAGCRFSGLAGVL